jgi:protease I
MAKTRRLHDQRIAVLAADGFEKVELTLPVKALRAAGADIDVISLRHGRIRGVNLHEPASRVSVDRVIEEADAMDYDALFIPGGFISPDLLRQSARARAFVRAFHSAGKPIASLCHGPWLLASAELLQDRTLTSWPGIRDDMVNSGATWLDQEVVIDRNLITSRGPQDLVPFIDAMIDLFSGTATVQKTSRVAMSSPRRNEPPQLMLKTMKWMPRPSLRTAIVIGAAAIGFLALNRRAA